MDEPKDSIDEVYERLFAWCEARGFAGYDPFDALNSRLFRRSPFRKSRLARFGLTQAVKRSPLNVRPLLRVQPGVNPKGIALFALGELSRYRTTGLDKYEGSARRLLEQLLTLGIRENGTLSYDYNFDWQSRKFFAPKGTPTIVPTAFASQAFSEGYDAFGDERYSDAVEQVAAFAATRLQRPIETEETLCLTYTPLDSSVIYNASLLAGECLARSQNEELRKLAAKTVNFVIARQTPDGAWGYGEGRGQEWIDNFHTAYVLLSIKRIRDVLPELVTDAATAAFESGLSYWKDNFFLDDGTPKYYNDRVAPIDIHSAAVAIAAAAELGEDALAWRVARWTVRNMLDAEGFFYYRVGNVIVDQTAYMRWGQAWMAYALARLLET